MLGVISYLLLISATYFDKISTTLCTVIIVAIWLFRLERSHRTISHVNERNVFITGCDTGFGRLLVGRLHNRGVPVYAGCLQQKSVDEINSMAFSGGAKILAVHCDVTDEQSVRRAARTISNDLGTGTGLWAVVNNAGISGVGLPFEWMRKADVQRIMDVNLLGVFDVSLAFLPLLRRNEDKGRLVNMVSITGRVAQYLHGYTMSKFAAEALSDGLSYEMQRFGLTVHSLEPAYFRTNILSLDQMEEKYRKRFRELEPRLQAEYGESSVVEQASYVRERFSKYPVEDDLTEVIDAYEHAILGAYPKNRYVVGKATWYFLLLSVLPFSMQQWITMKTAMRNAPFYRRM